MKKTSSSEKIFSNVVQFALPSLTIGGQLAIAMKHPELGLLIGLASQPFWFYSSWKAWREAGQVGILITTCIFTLITIAGIVNYWFL